MLEQKIAIEALDLQGYNVSPLLLTTLSEEIIRKYQVIPLNEEEQSIEVAMNDPFNLFIIEDLERLTAKRVIPKKASKKEIDHIMATYFHAKQTQNIMDEVEKKLMKQEPVGDQTKVEKEIAKEVEDSLTVKLVNHIIAKAVQKRASDIHIEPMQSTGRIRYRIDGVLQQEMEMPLTELICVVTRIKIVSKLNIAQKRIPQDGRMETIIDKQCIDMRISIFPTLYGEKVTIRLIYMRDFHFTIDDLDFTPQERLKFEQLLKKKNGILLLTGPTGSGKSTTLAAILRSLNSSQLNIVTIEDPVENKIEGINQVAIHPKAGLTFSNSLRGVLRQDPDIIMIGEMRDKETSSIAMRAAITGHLVLSTLHTNDATGSIIRLLDMGIEPFMVAAAIEGVIAQRLVRKLCPVCKKERSLTKTERMYLQIEEEGWVYESCGCEACHFTGYKGRKAVHEIFMMNDKISEAITSSKINHKQIKALAMESGMRTLKQNMREYVLKGETDLAEMYNIIYS
jgi:type IV pilus assembly protein PilB